MWSKIRFAFILILFPFLSYSQSGTVQAESGTQSGTQTVFINPADQGSSQVVGYWNVGDYVTYVLTGLTAGGYDFSFRVGAFEDCQFELRNNANNALLATVTYLLLEASVTSRHTQYKTYHYLLALLL
jgi:hypothetical protein